MFCHVNFLWFECWMVFVDFIWCQLVEKYGAINSLFAVLTELESEAANFIINIVPGQYDTFLGAMSCDYSYSLGYCVSYTFYGG